MVSSVKWYAKKVVQDESSQASFYFKCKINAANKLNLIFPQQYFESIYIYIITNSYI